MVMGERVIMSREILFKAKRKDNGEWIEGYYVYCRKRHYILQVLNKAIGFDEREYEWVEVDPDTICQYTGLTDKNGKKIWENDILRIGENAKLMVSWHHFKASWVLSKKGWMYNHFFGESVEPEDVEAVGNIFDNADLLEVE